MSGPSVAGGGVLANRGPGPVRRPRAADRFGAQGGHDRVRRRERDAGRGRGRAARLTRPWPRRVCSGGRIRSGGRRSRRSSSALRIRLSSERSLASGWRRSRFRRASRGWSRYPVALRGSCCAASFARTSCGFARSSSRDPEDGDAAGVERRVPNPVVGPWSAGARGRRRRPRRTGRARRSRPRSRRGSTFWTRLGEAGASDQSQEPLLVAALRAGAAACVQAERLLEDAQLPAGRARHRLARGRLAEQLPERRLVDHVRQVLGVHDVGQVHERARDGGDRDPVDDRHVPRARGSGTVRRSNPGCGRRSSRRDDVDHPGLVAEAAVQKDSSKGGQGGAIARRKNSRHPAPLAREIRVPVRIDAAVLRVQAARPHPLRDAGLCSARVWSLRSAPCCRAATSHGGGDVLVHPL